ncbi:NADP-dependent oxidoreductase [Nocardia sp. NPDC101769]|uniref:NADP-dependent oxidoreductase n=1 Tax=Nocardia sp. NPDC101769 TaxID=3364333 RepID=UPI003802CF5A
MRAVRIDRFGGFEVLRTAEVPESAAGAGEVVIRTVATSINPVDDKTRGGEIGGDTPSFPITLGWDLAGIVIDPGASEFPSGERVFAMSHQLDTGRGTWADVVVMPAESVAPAPARISLVEAATLPLAGSTALQTLDWLAVSPGDRLLVTGAAGAVGNIALQVAHARGVHVDALVSRDADVDLAHAHGAKLATTEPAALPHRGYDAVFDTYGAFVTDAVADGGRYASIATQAGPLPDMSARSVRSTIHQVRENGALLRELAAHVDEGSLRTRVDAIFGIHEIRRAHERFADKNRRGKVVVTF